MQYQIEIHPFSNMIRLTLVFLFFFLLQNTIVQAQEIVFTGVVSDANTNENLVFVSISKNKKDGGTTTDLDGRFSIEAKRGDTLYFSYVGYSDQNVILDENQNLTIKLLPQTAILQEIIVTPGENPAWRIIRAVRAHRKENDPQQFDGYSYEAYHKTVMAMDSLSAKDTWKPAQEPKKERQKEALERAGEMRQLFSEKMHLWVTESFTTTQFRYPAQYKETINGYTSSMPNDFTGGLNPIDFQPFGFYQDLIRIEFTNQNYVNPISKGCFRHYDFEIKDTLFHNIDTTFVIAFKPQKNKHFVALEGLLYINTYGYAIENVIAAPADKNQTLQFEIQQQSKLIDGRWFPQQLHTDLFINMAFQDRFIQYAFRNRSMISDLDFGVPDKAIFNQYLRENTASQTSFPDTLRPLPLNEQEKNTYTYWDSLPALRGPYRLLKSYNGLVKIMATGLLEGKRLDLVLIDVVQNNQYEGWRLGLGLQTSPKWLEKHTFYGYGAYGFKDESWKYGGAWDIHIYPHRDVRFRLSYKQDIEEPGRTNFLSVVNRPWTGFDSRNFSLSRLDQVEQSRIDLFFRPHPAWQFNVFTQKEARNINYNYSYYRNGQFWRNFHLTQVGWRLRWAPKEKLVKMDQLEAVLYPSFPIVNVSMIYGKLDQLSLPFVKIASRFDHEFRWRYLGTTSLIVEGGFTNKSLPYPYLYQVVGNNSTGIAAAATFNTAGLTEFVNQSYVYAFIRHDFGHLLGKFDKTPWFRPELSLIQNIGWGKNTASLSAHSFELKDFSKTYLESGLGMKNILRIPYFKTVYIGIGAAAYYRWGAYQLPVLKDNLFMQLLVNISV